ncbi:MAG: 30S ribosomal protein S4 [Planctomycetota bacterium]
MGRTIGPKCKLCRAEGQRLFLRGARCESVKCPFNASEGPRRRTPSKPGAKMTQRRRRPTEYGRQLREKQKLKRFYGVYERQFRHFYDRANRMQGNTGVNLLVLLECRLDNVVFLSGLASSRSQARQFVNHGFIFKDGKRVDIPSYIVDAGDEFQFKGAKETLVAVLKENMAQGKSRELPAWLDLSAVASELKFKVKSRPLREAVSAPVNERLIVELCSK